MRDLPSRKTRGITLLMRDVSRHHCELFLRNNILFLKDTSTNGTIVGHKKIRGESISIDVRTKVVFSENAMMTVSPNGCGEVIRGTSLPFYIMTTVLIVVVVVLGTNVFISSKYNGGLYLTGLFGVLANACVLFLLVFLAALTSAREEQGEK